MIENLIEYKNKLKKIGVIEYKINRLSDMSDIYNDEYIQNEIKQLSLQTKNIMFEMLEIDVALEQLDAESRFLIKAKYVFNKKWIDIEEEYHRTFKDKSPILQRQIIRNTNKAIKQLSKIMQSQAI